MSFGYVSIATELSSSPPGEYAQEIPIRPHGGKQSGPPILPPHLLQVILNKDTPAHVSTIMAWNDQFVHLCLRLRKGFRFVPKGPFSSYLPVHLYISLSVHRSPSGAHVTAIYSSCRR